MCSFYLKKRWKTATRSVTTERTQTSLAQQRHRTRQCAQESFQSPNAIFDAWEKSGSPGNKKKVICFQIFRKINSFSKKIPQHWWRRWRSPRPRRRWLKTLLPFVDHNVKVSWQRRDTSNNIDAITLESFQMPTPTLELSTAREECCQKRHCGVHDGIGHAKPPQLSVGIHHDGRQCQCAEVIQSLFKPFRENYSHCNPPARGELGPLHVVLLVDKEELLVWWHMETRRPNREQTSWSADTFLSQHRRHCVTPRQTLLDQIEEFPPLLGHCGRRRTTFWSHFVVHVGAGRAKLPHVVEETELLLRSADADHLLTLRVDLSNWTPSQGDGIQGAEIKTVLCGIGSLEGCYVRILLLLKMAPKFSRDHHVRNRTTIGEWHRNNTEWVRHISWVDAEARRALLADASILEPNSAACTIRPHTGRACILMQAETDDALRQSTRFNPMWKIWISWTSWKNPLFLTKIFEKHPFPQIFLRKKKSSFVQNSFCGNLFPFWKMSFSSFSESCFMISLLCFSLKMYIREYLLSKKMFSWTKLNFFHLLFDFLLLFF